MDGRAYITNTQDYSNTKAGGVNRYSRQTRMTGPDPRQPEASRRSKRRSKKHDGFLSNYSLGGKRVSVDM